MTSGIRSQFWHSDGRRLSGLSTLLLLLPFFAIIAFVFVYPIGQLLWISFTEPKPTLDNYARVVTNPVYARVLLRTLWTAVLVTGLCVILGFPVAYYMSRARAAVAAFVGVCVILPLWSSVLVRTAAWSFLLQRQGLVNSGLMATGITSEPLKLLYTQSAVVVAMAHVLLPFMILPIFGALRSIPDDYMRAAAVLGAPRFRTFLEVILPLSLPGIASGSLLVFLTALGFFITPALLGSPQELMIATLVSQQIREVLDWPFASALVGVLTLFVTLLALIFSKTLRFDRLMGAQ
ncbi:mannopine transport system permease protein [Rhizobium petrolearium]|uniref:ABC transporter permease n=1 Tax=Neorhizobium petrolearium TaxID=515361 RepID=UPI001AE898A4|nr:ABC transporter permease [Neorhizobium petrolearium]MBP1845657.1 mannopine transport system permease protein [Neorhizobium petrolearium]